MGVAVSGWPLARAISAAGQLGVVSGTALAMVLARRLQLGDPSGDLRRALAHFPFPAMAARIEHEYFVPGGKDATTPFKALPMPRLHPPAALLELTVVANFVEVFLAKEGHSGPVGINFLEKIQLPTLPSLFGAMLAGVDYVLMGAGIPRSIPGVLDHLSKGQLARLRIDVENAEATDEHTCNFDPTAFCNGPAPELKRPRFIGIVSSATLAMTLARKASGRVDGFIVETSIAGGHNAPPRGVLQLTATGEPLYGPRDEAELDKIAALGLPFWLAGGFGSGGKLKEALRLGATGIQVGTPFAFCDESGLAPELKQQVLKLSRAGQAQVFTDPTASPTGFPFKVVQVQGTLSQDEIYLKRRRICDLGYLRKVYRRADGTIGYRCPAEPIEQFIKKGGNDEQVRGRKCICNGLPAAIGLGQNRADGTTEAALLTAGDDVKDVARFLSPGQSSYSAAAVLNRLLADLHDGSQ